MQNKIKEQDYYTVGGIQPIEYIRAKLTSEQYEGFLLGNIIKYISRYPHKNGIEDLLKADTYMDWLIHHAINSQDSSDKRDSSISDFYEKRD